MLFGIIRPDSQQTQIVWGLNDFLELLLFLSLPRILFGMPVVVCGHHKCFESCFTVLLPILGYFEEEPPVLFKPLVIPSISLRGSLFVVHVLPG